MRYFQFLFFVLVITNSISTAQNPISPNGLYIANPSAHVWADGKLYIYGSNNESPNYFSSWTYHVLATSDLKTWELTSNVFKSKGIADSVSYNDNRLMAPDCQYKNGTYYLYYCQSSNGVEGVATSKSAVGPFGNAKKIDTKPIDEIDPCVFIDDDGQAYYIWGQFTAKMAKLKPNMTEIDSSTIKDNIVTEKEHFFHEGGYMVKRNGIYYFIYAHMGRLNMPTCLGYATSKSPFGPFKYRGVIIDNSHCDPNNWNNHGSLVEFKGKWYVLYHRATENSYVMRKTCIEPITFNEDGSINEVEMTSQGAGDPLNATSKIEAEWACLLFGNSYISSFSNNENGLKNLKDGDRVVYKYIDFPATITKIELRLKPGKKGGKIKLTLDQTWHPSFATIDVPPSNTDEWVNIEANVKPTPGVHGLWLKFNGDSDAVIDIDWFRFSN
ncbi:MAG: family 43 glycosylhydrolase [Paludibacter sp.]